MVQTKRIGKHSTKNTTFSCFQSFLLLPRDIAYGAFYLTMFDEMKKGERERRGCTRYTDCCSRNHLFELKKLHSCRRHFNYRPRPLLGETAEISVNETLGKLGVVKKRGDLFTKIPVSSFCPRLTSFPPRWSFERSLHSEGQNLP